MLSPAIALIDQTAQAQTLTSLSTGQVIQADGGSGLVSPAATSAGIPASIPASGNVIGPVSPSMHFITPSSVGPLGDAPFTIGGATSGATLTHVFSIVSTIPASIGGSGNQTSLLAPGAAGVATTFSALIPTIATAAPAQPQAAAMGAASLTDALAAYAAAHFGGSNLYPPYIDPSFAVATAFT